MIWVIIISHASNTVPSAKGGLSGKIVMPYTMKIIDYIKNKHPHVKIIAGGGVFTKRDADAYIKGADHTLRKCKFYTLEDQRYYKWLNV